MRVFQLMHRDTVTALIMLDDLYERIEGVKTVNCLPQSGPFLGNVTKENLQIWWSHRAIPGNREDLRDMLAQNHCSTAGEYMAINLALSLTDSYWIRPLELDTLVWKDVNLFRHGDGDKLELHRHSLFHSSSSLNGQMKKYWERIPGENGCDPYENYLVKKSELSEGQQNINEAFAAFVHERQGMQQDMDYVTYKVLIMEGKAVGSRCRAFTSEREELVYASELAYAQKSRNGESVYETIIRICGENGLEPDSVRRKLDYMTATDFVLSNQDRHLNNFGVLRDAEAMHFLRLAPLYDTGNSMHWDSLGTKSRYDLLNESTSGFARHSADLLHYVSDRSILDVTKLPSREETKAFYQQYGISEERAEVIAANYAGKAELFTEFQQGKDFSLYRERVQSRNGFSR